MAKIKRSGSNIKSQDSTIANGASALLGYEQKDFISHWYDKQEPGIIIPSVGTTDVTNVSSLDANLIDGNLTNLCYNNNSGGSANKELPGIDLGAPEDVSQIRIYWWNATYVGSTFNIEYSNDAVTWSTAGTFNGTFVGVSTPEDFYFPSITARYWRLFSITGSNPTFVVMSEMQAFSPSGNSTQTLADGIDLDVEVLPSGEVQMRNNTGASIDIKTYYNA